LLRTRVLSAMVLIPIVAALVYLAAGFSSPGWPWSPSCASSRFAAAGADRPPADVWHHALLRGPACERPVPSVERHRVHHHRRLLVKHLVATPAAGPGHPDADWAVTFGFGLYLGWLIGRFIAIRALPDGMLWFASALLITWATDTGAYFVGHLPRQEQACAQLSPKKTWEGIIGGWIAADGALASGWRWWLDEAIMRVMDALFAFPALLCWRWRSSPGWTRAGERHPGDRPSPTSLYSPA